MISFFWGPKIAKGIVQKIERFKNFVYTYRIFKERHGFYNIQTVEGAPKQIFSNLKELISTFEKPNQGLVVHLGHPIKQASFCPRWRRSQIKLDGIYENSNSDYVEVLP
ncbi:SH2 domain-containing protein 1B [Leptonychotes weddellii]|uniref:SH2 domain-containing protein 1B n=1 Tax=Leptonychotes weddellii TaxID=9713 RepID=A0A2U3YYL2_LEPWE|nr:SH2 domain-containing protein 1B [Leptonychotes weddellii]